MFAVICTLILATPCAAAELPPHVIVAYHDSWDEPRVDAPEHSTLAQLPGFVNVVDLAFAKPDAAYRGDLDLTDTGLEYRYSGEILRASIDLLKARHPNTHVLLSVGGAAYHEWDDFDPQSIAALVHDLHADGVDLDFEPRHPNCAAAPDQHIRCSSDGEWRRLVQQLRDVLPRPAVLTVSAWSVGAYGEGAFLTAKPRSPYTGFMLSLLRSPIAAQIDLISIDAYDAGPSFDPIEAFRAYRAIWPGKLALGLELSRKGGEGPFYSQAAAETLARQVAKDPEGGMMLYPLLARPEGTDSATSPDGRALIMALCRGLTSGNCEWSP